MGRSLEKAANPAVVTMHGSREPLTLANCKSWTVSESLNGSLSNEPDLGDRDLMGRTLEENHDLSPSSGTEQKGEWVPHEGVYVVCLANLPPVPEPLCQVLLLPNNLPLPRLCT